METNAHYFSYHIFVFETLASKHVIVNSVERIQQLNNAFIDILNFQGFTQEEERPEVFPFKAIPHYSQPK